MNRFRYLAAALALAAAPADPSPFPEHPARPATLERVIDGDTAVFVLDLDFGVSVKRHVRFEGFNAPELHGPHKLQALAAKAAVAAILASGDVWVKPSGAESAGRTVAKVYVVRKGGVADAAGEMQALGFDVPQGD